ncbi:MAG: hypothetical protein LBR41_00125 [Rickettsiales bacterium]|jgi:hypothetical protein|nr:hypothetical protein [Rickettsiales bacterium]
MKNIFTVKKPVPYITIDDAELLLESLRKLYTKPGNDSKLKTLIRNLAKSVLYLLSETRRANYMSEEAFSEWTKNKMDGDLQNLTTAKQRFNKKEYPMLDKLILEHCNPLSGIVKKMFEKNMNIKKVIQEDLKTAWITKKEDDRLCGKLSHTRKGGWRKCYEEKGIKWYRQNQTN